MRLSIVAVVGCMLAFGGVVLAKDNLSSVEALQAEISRLKEQLAKLEAQLAEVQKQQKSIQQVTKKVEPLRFGGYIQMRYERDSSRATDSTDLKKAAKENFKLSRTRFDLRATPFKGGLLRLQIDTAGTEILLKDAYLELPLGDGKVVFGHFKVPLLEEVLESSSVRWTPERAKVSTALFPDGRDRGVAYTWSKKGMPEVTVGLFSGTRTEKTQDSLTSRKSWLVRVVQPLDKEGKLGKVWVGRMDGIGRKDFGGNQILNFDRERTVAGLLLTPISGLTLRGEWVDGKDAGTATTPTLKVRGWYALLGYKLPGQPLTLYAKHDQYDPDRKKKGDTFSRNALGIQYDLNAATRLNLTWEKQKRPDATIWTFQTQLKY
ncbi:MAG: porin [Candidatus Fervidibacter sp.]|uniref:porin n=1 Tax=Candidatus Fervidibacter sp. TaxID=3100871 RepID=UPI00404B8642